MKSTKHRITLKVLIGYIILGALATISGILVLSEIKIFTKLQTQDISDRNKIVKIGSLIADIYKNESLGRAAIQLNSEKKFNDYITENELLLKKIDSINHNVNNSPQELILDSIKLVTSKKLKNTIDLKNLNHSNTPDTSINTAINKLSSIDAILGKVSITDFVKNPKTLDEKTKKNLQEYVKILNKYNPNTPISSIDQKRIDSILSISTTMLKNAQRKINVQRKNLKLKEQLLIENDITISRKLRELLNALERETISYANTINTQRKKTFNHSKSIILFSAGLSFITVIIFSIIIFNDFWKSQRYRKQLEDAHKTTSSILKTREHIISMVSHDLRTPLSKVTGYSELLQKSTNNSKEKNYIKHIQNASTYMKQLVDDLLEFSKLENNTISIESVPFDIEKLINEVIEDSKTLIKDKPIKLTANHDKAIHHPIISAPFRLKQILHNLISNACKFTNQGSINVESVLKNDGNDQILQISVSDTGIGIGEEQQANVFKAFTQANNNSNNKSNGFGLGLTISKKLAELLHGTLNLKSELGKGSIFTLNIPISFSKTALSSPKCNENAPTYNLSAVIVEDDVSMQYLLHDMLKQYGITSHKFNNAQVALDVIDKIPYDVVITDIQLPKMNGIHFMEVLKNHSSYNGQPFIAMTGRLNLTINDYTNNGFSGVLIKPFKSNELQKILHQLFGHNVLSYDTKKTKGNSKTPNGFNIENLRAILGDDDVEIKNFLDIFLQDTKKNISELKQSKKTNDIQTINSVSHKMLSMFKQLDVKTIVPILETLQHSKTIDHSQFSDLEDRLNTFITKLEAYIN
ncbi:ATP-binding protein [Flavobacteriaceae bacterium MHTCC 0001]